MHDKTKEIEFIKELYKPAQPSVKIDQKNITYQEFKPCKDIENFIYCYWQLKTNKTLKDSFVYKVVSDGCIDFFFNLGKPQESFVMGFCRKYTEFSLERNFNYVGVRFFPSIFPLLFNVNAKELSNGYKELEQVVPKLSLFIANSISPSYNLPIIAKKLDVFFSSVLSDLSLKFDSRFYKALHLILSKFGDLETEKSLDTGLSSRQLRRIFNYYIGTTPKAFSKVVRFQYVLNVEPSVQSLRESKIFYDVGFFDQAHFIKDFKNFYGVTPTEAFQ